MNAVTLTKPQTRTVVATLVICAIGVTVALNWPRGDALATAMQPLIEQQNTDQSLVARAILENYNETRSNASKWSGVYWGFTFIAATFSALAGLILKFEAILRNAKLKKDVAALLSVGAALLIKISTSGDFQRKWQANRVAASELERTAYEFLENKAADPRNYFAAIGDAIHKRNLAVVGSMEQQKSSSDAVRKPTKDQQ
ncbi:MAG: DUF4231 domain-containing protein [bacterium]|nr:DUF4231 domain-containing protein [bacterium]